MMHRTLRTLGELERAVMEHVWGTDTEVSVREVHEALRHERDLAYTTVMTVMSRLTHKGILTRRRDGRAYLYRATDSREQLAATSIRDQLAGLEAQDRRVALLHFLDGASAEELDDLRAALRAVEARTTRAS